MYNARCAAKIFKSHQVESNETSIIFVVKCASIDTNLKTILGQTVLTGVVALQNSMVPTGKARADKRESAMDTDVNFAASPRKTTKELWMFTIKYHLKRSTIFQTKTKTIFKLTIWII